MALLSYYLISKRYFIKKSFKILIIILIIINFIPNHLFTIVLITNQTLKDVWPTSLYIERDAYKILRELSNIKYKNVMCNRDLGVKVFVYSQNKVLLGHWGTTPNLGLKKKEFRRFCKLSEISYRKKILKKYNIDFIIIGPRDGFEFKDFNKLAEEKISFGRYSLWKVKLEKVKQLKKIQRNRNKEKIKIKKRNYKIQNLLK